MPRNATQEEKRIAADILIAALGSNYLFAPQGDNEDARKQLTEAYRAILKEVAANLRETSE